MLFQSHPSGSIFFRSRVAREIGTWTNWWFQKATTVLDGPVIPAWTALCPRSRQNGK